MKVSVHQPDLLPYSGFWYKLARADIFDLKIHDQFVQRGYQRRVKMRDQWASLPTESCSRDTPIDEVRYKPGAAELLCNFVKGRYRGAPYWSERGDAVLETIGRSEGVHSLWLFNLNLLKGVRALLGIDTPFGLTTEPVGAKSAGIVEIMQRYGADTYLSGTGGRAYMGDCHEFTEAGIAVEFSRHRAVTGDSILTVLFDHEDPMSVVLAEHAEEQAA